MSNIETSQTEPKPVFIQIAEEIEQMMRKSFINCLTDGIDFTVVGLASKLEKDFEALYDIWVREDDDYIAKDDAMEYCRDNYEPPEYDR